MPQAIPYIVAAAVPTAYATVAYIATSILVGVYQYDRAKSRARKLAAALGGDSRSITIRSAIAPRQLVLGTTRVPGILHYAEFVGTQEEYFDIVLAFAHHQLAAVQGVYVGQEFIAAANIVSQVPTSGTYATQATLTTTEWFASSGISITLAHAPVNAGAVKVTANIGTIVDPVSVELAVSTVVGNVVTLTAAPIGSVTVDYSYLSDPALRLQWVLGTTSQAAMAWSGLTTPKWGADHRLFGIAALRALHLAEHSLYASGYPDISLVATGPVNVWDPRASGGAGAFINTGTSNPALLAAWYRTLPKADGGMGIPSTWIDWPSVAAAANICDELVTVNKLDGSGTEQIKRYECNIVLKLADGVGANDNLRAILGTMAGEFPFTGGLYRCFAGAYRAPVFTLTDEDVSADEALTFTPASGGFKKPPNVIAASIFDKAKGYVETGVPEVANATYITLDGGEELEEIALPGVTDARQANYLMGVALERSRPRMAGQLSGGGKLRNATLLDAVQFSLDGYSELAGKVFEIRQWGNDFKGNHPIVIREVKASDWALDPNTFTPVSQPTPPDLSYLLVVSDIAGLDAFSGDAERAMLHDGTVVARIRVTWTLHSQAYVRETGRIELRWKRASATAWTDEPSLPGSATSAYLLPVADGELYLIQVRAVNGRGAYCRWAQVLEVAAPVTGAQGSAGLVLVPHGVSGALLVRGRNVLKIGGAAAWDSAVRSEVAIKGGCELRFRGSANAFAGLNVDAATDADVNGIDFAAGRLGGSNWLVVASGTTLASGAGATDDTVWVLRHNGAVVEVRRDDAVVARRKVPIGTNYYLDTSLFTPGSSRLDDLQFTPLTAKPVEYLASSYGASTTPPGSFIAGLRHIDAGADEISLNRSYNFARISVATGLVTFEQDYDVFGNGAVTSGRNAATLAADLNATGDDSYVVVIGLDEPQTNRLTSGLDAAMYRCGASPRIFGAPGFKFRAAYILIGRGNIGPGKGYEAYRGEIDSDTSAYLQVPFQITQAGHLLVDGQPFAGLLDGVVGTGQLGVNAATDTNLISGEVSFIDSSFTSPSYPAVHSDLQTLSYTNNGSLAIKVQFEVSGGAFTSAAGGAADSFARVTVRYTSTSSGSMSWDYDQEGGSPRPLTWRWVRIHEMTLQPGDSVQFHVDGQWRAATSGAANAGYVGIQNAIRYAAIKR